MSLKRLYNKQKFWFVLVTAILALSLYFFLDASFLVRSLATVAFVAIFYIGDHLYQINFETRHYVSFVLIVVLGVLASPIYFIHPQYDKVLHFVEPILIASMAFFMINKLPLEKKWKLWFTFFITVAILGIFEMAEYTIDQFFDFKLQGVFLRDVTGIDKLNVIQEPLDDTMIDLFFGVIGASVYGIYKSVRLKRKR